MGTSEFTDAMYAIKQTLHHSMQMLESVNTMVENWGRPVRSSNMRCPSIADGAWDPHRPRLSPPLPTNSRQSKDLIQQIRSSHEVI